MVGVHQCMTVYEPHVNVNILDIKLLGFNVFKVIVKL